MSGNGGEGWWIDGARADAPLLVLAHGAGVGADSPFMRRMAEAIAGHGVMVARFEFAYMRRRRESGRRVPPPRAETLLAEWREAVEHWRGRRPLFIGGKSMGGRMASMLADELHERGLADGLVCLGYPFHAPGRPEKPRIEHLRSLRTPTLICQGTRDPFGSREEVAEYALSPMIRLFWLADGDHDFKPRVKSGESWEGNLRAAARAVAEFVHAPGDAVRSR